MNLKKGEDKIAQILNDAGQVRDIIQSGIDAALLKHKQAGNPVCGWKNGQVYWVEPENIPIKK